MPKGKKKIKLLPLLPTVTNINRDDIKPSSKQLKQELIDIVKTEPQVAMIVPVKQEPKKEENDTVIIDTPDTSFIPYDFPKFENDDLILIENPENSFLRISFKSEPYDDDIIYMGTSIEPLIISDDDDDELMYISTTRDDDVEIIKSEFNNVIEIGESDIDPDIIDLDHSMENLTVGNNKRRKKVNSAQGSKKKKQRKNTTTPSGKKPGQRTSTPTDTMKGQTHKSVETRSVSTNTDPDSSFTNSQDMPSDSAEKSPQSEDKGVQTFETNLKNNANFLVKRKLGFYRYKNNEHFLKYAIDYVTNEEYMFVYRLSDSYMRIFMKESEPAMFLQTFYDLVSSPDAFQQNYRRIMPRLERYICETMRRRRSQISHPINSYTFWYTYSFSTRIIAYGNFFIMKATHNYNRSQMYIVSPMENCEALRIYPSSVQEYPNINNVFHRYMNVIFSCRKFYQMIKHAFLKRMNYGYQ